MPGLSFFRIANFDRHVIGNYVLRIYRIETDLLNLSVKLSPGNASTEN